jgi:hypothetical protein
MLRRLLARRLRLERRATGNAARSVVSCRTAVSRKIHIPHIVAHRDMQQPLASLRLAESRYSTNDLRRLHRYLDPFISVWASPWL